MKNRIIKTVMAVTMLLGMGVAVVNGAHAEGEENTTSNNEVQASLTLSPVSKTLQISSNSVYDDTISVTNDSDRVTTVAVYPKPYSYVYSEQDDDYKLGFSHENTYTQISRWITVQDASGNYVAQTTYELQPHENKTIAYKITTPDGIPAGGQYAVLFVQTVSKKTEGSGINTEASAGMVIYGHSTEGETVTSSAFRDMSIERGVITGVDENGKNIVRDNFYGTAKVKNEGNTDFYARGVLKVTPIIGFSSYETPGNEGTVSVIPESERIVADEWEDRPDFGIYNISWTVTAGEHTETIEKVVLLISPLSGFLIILCLTLIIIGIIMLIKKRKERRSRLAI